MSIDVDIDIVNYNSLSNCDFVYEVYIIIVKKYYWWSWIVMVIDYLMDNYKFMVYVCLGIIN